MKSPITKRDGISALLGLFGVGIIFYGDFGLTPRALLGDGLALAGALMASLYLMTGKKVREEVPLMGYLSMVNVQASLTIAILLRIMPFSLSSPSFVDIFALMGLILGPSLLGHTALNWAMKYFQAYQVNLSILLEPVGATLWAYLFFHEIPHLLFYPGALLIISSIVLACLPHNN